MVAKPISLEAPGPASLEQSKLANEELVIKRIFEAPRELVFRTWTEQEHLERWHGAPRDMTVTVAEMDFRPGGRFRICMCSAAGHQVWLQGEYREIEFPARIVFTHVWLDASGKPGHETVVTLTFVDCDGRTELTLRQSGFKSVASRDGHSLGWTSTFDRWEEYLRDIQAC